ncbi:unnamed protein product [Boreogadus saida]
MEAEQTAEVNAIVFNVAATMQHIFRRATSTYVWRPTGEHFLRDLRMDVEKPIGFDAIMRIRTSTEFGVIPVHRDTELFAYGGCGPVVCSAYEGRAILA